MGQLLQGKAVLPPHTAASSKAGGIPALNKARSQHQEGINIHSTLACPPRLGLAAKCSQLGLVSQQTSLNLHNGFLSVQPATSQRSASPQQLPLLQVGEEVAKDAPWPPASSEPQGRGGTSTCPDVKHPFSPHPAHSSRSHKDTVSISVGPHVAQPQTGLQTALKAEQEQRGYAMQAGVKYLSEFKQVTRRKPGRKKEE